MVVFIVNIAILDWNGSNGVMVALGTVAPQARVRFPVTALLTFEKLGSKALFVRAREAFYQLFFQEKQGLNSSLSLTMSRDSSRNSQKSLYIGLDEGIICNAKSLISQAFQNPGF